MQSFGTSRRGPGTARIRFHGVSALPKQRFAPRHPGRDGSSVGEGASAQIQPVSVGTHSPSDLGTTVGHRAPTPAVSGALLGAPPRTAPAGAGPGGPQHPLCGQSSALCLSWPLDAQAPGQWERRAQHCGADANEPPFPLPLAVLGVRTWASSDLASRNLLAVRPAHPPFVSELQTR